MDKKEISVSLIIPTYNDQQAIIGQVLACEKILQKLSKKYEIILADDKSTDNTWQLLQENFKNKKNYHLIRNQNNLGITKNMLNLYFIGKLDFILLYSADGDWNPDDVGNLIRTQIKQNADIVIGRRKKKIGYTYYRNFISMMHRLLPLLFFRIDTIDPGGIKLVRRKLIHVPLVSTSQFFEAEIIIRAKKKGHKISFYPVSYKKPKSGSGHGGALISAIMSFIDLLKLRIKFY